MASAISSTSKKEPGVSQKPLGSVKRGYANPKTSGYKDDDTQMTQIY